MDTELQEYLDEVVRCLVKYGGLEQVEAQQWVNNSPVFEIRNEMYRMLLFHEEPYYWAMSMLYDKTNPLWFNDPKLWPPPRE